MDWFKVYPSELLADARRQHLSFEAQGFLLQACAVMALYDGDLDLSDLRQELRPMPSYRRFAHLITVCGPLIDTYLSDVQHQASAYAEKARSARRSARARWSKRGVAPNAHDANASACAPTDAHAEKKEEIRSPLPPKGDVHDHAFGRFWQAYPRKVNKARAEKAWHKLRPDDALVARMLDAIAWQREQPQWTKDQGAFVPHPTTWLNGRRWEDERPGSTAVTTDDSDLYRPPTMRMVSR